MAQSLKSFDDRYQQNVHDINVVDILCDKVTGEWLKPSHMSCAQENIDCPQTLQLL